MKRLFSLLLTLFLFLPLSAKSYSPDEAKVLREKVVTEVKKYIGCTYKLGAIGPTSFDCSGLIYTVYHDAAGIQMPRSAKAIYSAAKIVQLQQCKPGDLVFFKTTGTSQISHVGIYIGRNQFIHAASDGSNNGVIASSLKEKYWSSCFAAAGKIIVANEDEIVQANEENATSENVAENTENSLSKDGENTTPSLASSNKSSKPWYNYISFDAAVAADWQFWLPTRFMLNYRGIAVTTSARYTKWALKPGVGAIFRYNAGVGSFQMPLIFSLNFSEYVRVYAGPVITFGNPHLPDSTTPIKGSVFPGIIGVSWQTPALKIGNVRLALMQDLCYTVFNKDDNSALSFSDSFVTGFVFSTGIRVTIPMSAFL